MKGQGHPTNDSDRAAELRRRFASKDTTNVGGYQKHGHIKGGNAEDTCSLCGHQYSKNLPHHIRYACQSDQVQR